MNQSLSTFHAPSAGLFPAWRIRSSGSVEAWILTLTMAGYPIVASVSQLFDMENRWLSISMRTLLLIICSYLLVRFFPMHLCRRTIKFWFAWWFFWIIYLIRLVLDTIYNSDALQLPAWEYMIFAFGTCMIPASVSVLGNVKGSVVFSLPRLQLFMVLGLMLNLFFVFFIQTDVSDIDLSVLRVETITLNPITIGHLGVSVLLLALWKANDCNHLSLMGWFSIIFAAIVAVIAVISSGSRGPFISFFAALALYITILPKHFFTKLTLFGFTFFLVFILFNMEKLGSTFLFERISEHLLEDNIRTMLISNAFDIIINHPLFGGGIEPLETYPHNLIVESFLVLGIFTGLPFCFMVFYAIRKTWDVAQVNRSSFWVCLLFTQYFIAAMFSGSIYLSNVFWVLMVLVVSLSAPIDRLPPKSNQFRRI